MEFNCVQECSQCCVDREYFPDKAHGKIGVLILPEEKKKIENLARKYELSINILPRVGISQKKDEQPIVLAYQMMGIEKNGNTCPFLDTKTENRSPHGGYLCKIYSDRPLACKAYPLIQINPIELDKKCKFCKENGNADENLHSEIESLIKIRDKVNSDMKIIWRYATGIGEESDKDQIKKGWIKEN